MSRRSLFFCISLFFFIQFIIFSYVVHKDIFNTLDFNTTVHLQDHISRRFDKIFSFLSDIGKFEVMSVVLIVLVLMGRKLWAGIVTILLFISFHVIELFGKFFVNHPPPMEFMLRTKRMIDFPQFHVRSEFSYPSGHAGRALFVSIIVGIMVWRARRIPVWGKCMITFGLVTYDSVMLLSRIVMGEHWLSDVIGGTLLGTALGCLAAVIYLPASQKRLRN